MQCSSKEDIEAPIDAVFAMLSEFETFERRAIRRGAEVQRSGDLRPPRVGMSWDARFVLRGKTRDLHIELTEYQPPNGMKFTASSPNLQGGFAIELMALSPRRTRVSIKVTVDPKTLAARLLLQSLRLAKKNLNKRFKLRFANFIKDMEERHSRRA